MIRVHSLALGMLSRPYLPAGIFVPPMVTSSPNVSVVAPLAPVRHTLPKGTISPIILRPFLPGREYDSSMDDRPKSCLMVCVELGAGVFNCAEPENTAHPKARASRK